MGDPVTLIEIKTILHISVLHKVVGPQPTSTVPTRGSTPHIRGQGKAQLSRGIHTIGRAIDDALVQQGRDRGVVQTDKAKESMLCFFEKAQG